MTKKKFNKVVCMLLALLMMVSVIFKGDLSAFAAGDEAIEPFAEAVEADAFAAEEGETAADEPLPADAPVEAEAEADEPLPAVAEAEMGTEGSQIEDVEVISADGIEAEALTVAPDEEPASTERNTRAYITNLAVTVHMKLFDSTGEPLKNARLRVKLGNNSWSGTEVMVSTDDTGYFTTELNWAHPNTAGTGGVVYVVIGFNGTPTFLDRGLTNPIYGTSSMSGLTNAINNFTPTDSFGTQAFIVQGEDGVICRYYRAAKLQFSMISGDAGAQFGTAEAPTTMTLGVMTRTIGFSGSGGNPASQSRTYFIGDTYGDLPVVIKTGHRFDGWFYTPTSDVQLLPSIMFTAVVDTNWDQTWYARWTPVEYQITYNANGGSGTPMQPTNFTYGDSNFNLSTNTYSRTGYKFKGWSTERNGDIVHAVTDTDPTPSVSSILYSEDTELFAVWYNIIKYDKNHSDASGTMVETDFKAGSSVTLQSNAFSRQHYDFMGWSTDPNATEPDPGYVNSATVSPSGGGTTTLYAVWSGNQYEVTYNKGHNDATGSMEPTPFTYGTDFTLSPIGFQREGFTFKGWSTAYGGSVVHPHQPGGISVSGTLYAADTELYAVWESEHTITAKYVDENGATLRADTTTTVSGGGNYSQAAPVISDYTAIGYKLDNLSSDLIGFSGSNAVINGVNASRTVYFVYHASNTLVSASVPVKLIFAAFASRGGEVTSPDYEITNRSILPVKVSVSAFNSVDLAGLNLVQNAPANNGDLRLGLAGESNFTTISSLPDGSLLGNSGYLGQLGSTGSATQTGRFSMNGRYQGGFGTVKEPRFKAVFTFEIVLPSTP